MIKKLGTFVLVAGVTFSSTLLNAEVDSQWSEGEHLELGEIGSQQACQELKLRGSLCPTKTVFRQDRVMKFSYGELLAAADYYLDPAALYEDKDEGVKQIIRCARRLRHDHPTHKPEDPKYFDCTIFGVLFVDGFLEIVSQNHDHFGWNNMKAYVRLHTKALELAQKAHYEQNKQASTIYLNQALITNAFADHFLSDGFAAGHVRLPRTQIKKWAKEKLSGPFKETRADILAILLHENDGYHFTSQKDFGLKVKNSRGDRWRTRGDQYLRVDENSKDPVYSIPLEAVKESVKEVLLTWKTGTVPTGEFKAARLTPFHVDLSLKKRFSEETQGQPLSQLIQWLHGNLPFFQRIFAPIGDLELMFEDIDLIFKQFRKDIATDIRQNPELSERLPSAYRDAFLRVN